MNFRKMREDMKEYEDRLNLKDSPSLDDEVRPPNPMDTAMDDGYQASQPQYACCSPQENDPKWAIRYEKEPSLESFTTRTTYSCVDCILRVTLEEQDFYELTLNENAPNENGPAYDTCNVKVSKAYMKHITDLIGD